MPTMNQLDPGYSFSADLGQALGGGLKQGLSQGLQQHLQKKENREQLGAFKPFLEKLGLKDEEVQSFIDSGLPPELGLKAIQIHAQKKQEDNQKFDMGLGTIEKMRAIVKKGNIGRGTGVTRLFGGKDARDAAEYEQLGTSLIPIVAAGVPIRNQKEFDQYRKILTDASSSNAEIEGALDGLQDIFQRKLEGKEGAEIGGGKAESKKLEAGAQLEKLPSAKDHKGLVVSNGKKRYQSNGKTWREIT